MRSYNYTRPLTDFEPQRAPMVTFCDELHGSKRPELDCRSSAHLLHLISARSLAQSTAKCLEDTFLKNAHL